MTFRLEWLDEGIPRVAYCEDDRLPQTLADACERGQVVAVREVSFYESRWADLLLRLATA